MMEQTNAVFPKTPWSLIDAIGDSDDSCRQQALEQLARMYWPAVYAFLRRSGKSRSDAVELTQAFFADVIVDRRLFDSADASVGRLRTLVHAALKNFLIDQHRRSTSGTFKLLLPLDELNHEEALIQQDHSKPEDYYQRRWAMAVIEEALRRCQAHFCSTGKASHWAAFEARVVRPALCMQAAPSHQQVAQEVQLDGPDASVKAVRVVRKRMLALIRQVLAESTKEERESEAEYRDIVAMLV